MKLIKGQEEVKGECAFCGGLGHRMANCTKLQQHKIKAIAASCISNTDVTKNMRFDKGGGYGGGEM